MPIWKTVLVLLLGLVCGVAGVAVSVWTLKKTAQAKVFDYKYRDVSVEVIDDDTAEPVAKAKVEVTYEDTHHFQQPQPDSAESNEKGMATVKFALKTTDLELSVEAKGYARVSDSCGSETQSPISCKLKKLPKITLTVPNGYVGPIRFNLPPRPKWGFSGTTPNPGPIRSNLPPRPNNIQKTVPHNEYQLHADAAGDVKIEEGGPLVNYHALEQALQRSYLTAAYEDGKKILLADEEGVNDSTIALRFVAYYYSWKDPKEINQQSAGQFLEKLDTNKPQEIFVIGTAEDQRALLKTLPVAERIGVDFDFDIHDPNWGRTPSGGTIGNGYTPQGQGF